MAETAAAHPYEIEPTTRPEGRYHTNQIAAHWIIVFLLVFQFATGPTMAEAMEVAYLADRLPPEGVIFVHGIIGLSILATMAWRVSLRLRFGAPSPPDTEPRPLQLLSRSVHFAFYAVLIAMPLFGLAATIWISEILGVLHAWASYALLGLMALHVSGGLWHAIKRDGVVKRILSGQAQRAR
jgi:cytochrome b561